MLTHPYYPQPRIDEPDPVTIVDFLRRQATEGYDFLKRVGMTPMIYGMIDEDTTKRGQRLPPDIRQAVVATARDLQPFYRWAEHRQVYPVHPALTRNLNRLNSSLELPGAAFRKLRHPNPLFVLPGAPEIQHPDGQHGRTIAFFVVGAISARYKEGMRDAAGNPLPPSGSILRSTDDEEINAYHLMIVSEILSPDRTKVVDHDFCRITIPILREFTLDYLVDRTVSDFAWSREIDEKATGQTKENYMTSVATITIAHLLYAISKNVQIDKPRNDKPRAKPTKADPKPPKPAKMMPMGYQMGARIKEYERRERDPNYVSPLTGSKKRPHVRGAHTHMYRVGPGRQDIEFKLLEPILINAHLDDGETATIHPVK